MRNIGLDVSRGMLMLYIVIVIHGVFYLNLLPEPYSSLLLLEMPLIFLISGYTFAITRKKINQIDMSSYTTYAKARVSRILIPYFGYALACVLYVSLSGEMSNYLDGLIAWLNPITYGKGASASVLSVHLWFIPTLLVVTLLLPLCNTSIISKMGTYPVLVILCVVFGIFDHLESKLAYPAFYLIWTFLGFRIGSGLEIPKKQLLWLAVIAFMSLLASNAFTNETLDMQANKFPPNLNFLAFSVLWVSFALSVKDQVSSNVVNNLSQNRIVRMFIDNGYSLYLWQGIGYSLAIYAGERFGMHVLAVWIAAVVLTIILAKLASPLEKVRWRQQRIVEKSTTYERRYD